MTSDPLLKRKLLRMFPPTCFVSFPLNSYGTQQNHPSEPTFFSGARKCVGVMDPLAFSADQFQSLANPTIKMVGAGEGHAVWLLGILIVVKALGNETGGSYSLFEDYVPAGAGPPMHFHTKEDETWYMLDGELEWYVGDKQFHATKGSFVHLPKFVPHSFANKSGKTAHMVLTYAPAGFEMWFLENGKPTNDINFHTHLPDTPENTAKAVTSARTDYGLVFLKPDEDHASAESSV